MIVVYIGSFDEVEFYEFDGQLDRRARRNEPVEVADATANGSEPGEGLLAQTDNWRPATDTEAAAFRAAKDDAPVVVDPPAPPTDEQPAVEQHDSGSNE